MTLPNVPKDPNMPEALRGWLERIKREIESTLSSIGSLVIPEAATEAEAEAGTVDDAYLSPETGVASVKAHAPFGKTFWVEDNKADGTDAGNFNTGSFVTRDLNTTIVNTISGASLSTNQVTLPAGTYYIEASAPAFKVEKHQTLLYNVTDAVNVKFGSSEYAANNTGGAQPSGQSRSQLMTYVTINASKEFELRHRCASSRSTDGLGRAANFGGEVYAQFKAWKLD